MPTCCGQQHKKEGLAAEALRRLWKLDQAMKLAKRTRMLVSRFAKTCARRCMIQ